MNDRSLVSAGDGARLARVMSKARRGESVTVGVIGGSITQGASASHDSKRYSNIVCEWWRKSFPKAKVEFVNAGIGATGSDYGALRVQRDLLSRNPDFVIVEYAVNDSNTRASAETFEGVIRQILKRENNPAVVLLFMMNKDGANAQEWFTKVGSHYGLPMVSYRDALWPEIQAGRMKWTDISPDEVHPNDRGHALAAGYVNNLLQRTLDQQAPDATPPAIPALPPPLFTGIYEFTELREANALKPVSNQGWTLSAEGWKADKPGSTIEFEMTGKVIFSAHYVIKGAMGRARVTIDEGAAKTLDGWFNQTWGGYRQTNIVGKDLPPGPHKIKFELLPDKSEGSTGNIFRILGLGAAGTAEK